MKNYNIEKQDNALVPIGGCSVSETYDSDTHYIFAQAKDYLHHKLDLKQVKHTKLVNLIHEAAGLTESITYVEEYLKARYTINKILTKGAVAIIREDLNIEDIRELVILRDNLARLTHMVITKAYKAE